MAWTLYEILRIEENASRRKIRSAYKALLTANLLDKTTNLLALEKKR